MGSRFILPLAAATASYVSAGQAHSISHGRFHTGNHHAHTRDVDNSTVTFPGVPMFPNGTLSGLGLSSTCEDVLYSTVDCDNNISSLMTGGYIGSFDNTTMTDLVCAASCATSIGGMYESVLTSCGDSAELIPGVSYLALVGQLWSNWNQSCFMDPTTDQNCNGEEICHLFSTFPARRDGTELANNAPSLPLDFIASFDNYTSQTDISTTNLCSYCYIKKLELMQQDAYSDVYNDDWQSAYEYVATTCNLTVSDFNVTASAFNASVPMSAPICVSSNIYTTKDGDTCDSIALSQGVSAATMYYTNPNILNCSDIITGTTLCLPLTCTDVYSVKPDDTCASIAVNNLITLDQVINWNSQLSWNCSNLVSPDPYWGSVLCVSTPGGNYTGLAANSSSSIDTASPVDPPAGVTVASGSTRDCGAWFVNDPSLGYNCSDICLANSIAIHLFVDANPSLNYTSCDTDLVPGDAYCIDPLPDWEYSNSTATKNSTITAATSPAWPVQTGIAPNCDAYYECQCTYPSPMTSRAAAQEVNIPQLVIPVTP